MISDRMIKFFNKHHLLTLATCCNNRPWCCQCFYVFIEHLCGLAIASDAATRHISEAMQQPYVAASIALETSVVNKLQGMQIEGKLIEAEGKLLKEIKIEYLKRFPYATLINTKYWFLELYTIKMTDNRLGFGKKLYWKK